MASPLAISFSSILLFVFFIILFQSPFLTSEIQSRNETERSALLAIKAKINQDPLGILESWNDSVHFCQWPGVSCGILHQRVIGLNLSSFGLVGRLSPHISNLTFLRGINLEFNNFHGKISQEIGFLSKLRHLNLTNNSFSGEIPANLSRCANLVFIGLGWNKLSGLIPFELGGLQKLERFQLHYNNLNGMVPESFGNLSSVRSFSFTGNNFQGTVPAVLGNLKNLMFLGLGLNQFSGMIPPSIFNVSSLIALSVPFNQFKGILPSDLGLTLPNLQVLNAGHNFFTGPVPASLSNASNLVELDLTGNRFIGKISINFRGSPNLRWLVLASNPFGLEKSDDLQFLDSLTNCSSLKVLDLSDCGFGGTLPYSVANLSTNLMSLRLSDNSLFGTIDVGIENLVGLTELQLQKNKFNGTVPTALNHLLNLQLMDLSENQFLGHIPSSLSNLTHLYLMHLQKNQLIGSIPNSFGNFHYLQELDLSQNHLNGSIPPNVMSFSSLMLSLNLAGNQFSGALPSEVGELKNLEYLNVSGNGLTGWIPSTIGSCVTLQQLDLSGNSFEGPIPSSFISLQSLEYLNLTRNNLSGQIPSFLENLSLKNLNLSFNQFEGEVPSEGIFRNAFAFSVRGNNKLCGGIREMKLPMCPKKETGERKSVFGLKLMVPLLSGLLVLVLVISLLIIHRSRRKHDTETLTMYSSEIRTFAKISYGSLHNATNGFSSDNMIGSGSFGSVYKGTIEPDQKVVAVKVFHLHTRMNTKRFMSECRALRNIKHLNLVKIHTFCSSVDFSGNEFKALVYEFMPRGSLETWIHGSSPQEEYLNEEIKILSLVQRVSIAIDVASAVDYLHNHWERPIVHCDLKPSNVLLDDDMTAHVGDFGLLKFVRQDISGPRMLSSSVGIRGTVGYSAPEYCVGSKYSPEGDVYSFGMVLLEMFTGKKPTDSVFKDGLNLHNFVNMSLPERIEEILDPTLLVVLNAKDEDQENESLAEVKVDQVRECIVSIMRIGVACSVERPEERMNIGDVVNELQLIKDIVLASTTNLQSSTSGSWRFDGSASRSATANWQNFL